MLPQTEIKAEAHVFFFSYVEHDDPFSPSSAKPESSLRMEPENTANTRAPSHGPRHRISRIHCLVNS